MGDTVHELAIVGAGPGGLSAAARAMEHGISHILLEAADKHANTIQQYQHHKHVMAEPSMLPLRSDVGFTAGTREDILDTWQKVIEDERLNVRFQSEVTAIEPGDGVFALTLKSGEVVHATTVILALGVQGNPRRLKVPGGQLPCVQYLLESAEALKDERIVVIGAGDAAIENAVTLATQNKVTLLNRGEGFPRAKEGNAAKISRAMRDGKVEVISNADVKSVEKSSGAAPYLMRVTSGDNEIDIPCHRIIARLGAVPARALIEGAGVRFVSDAPDAAPELTESFESNVPGLYVIGSLAGFPLIKQAMNQGYEVVERLVGNEVQPADHDILAARLGALRGGTNVEQTVNRIHDAVEMFREVKPLTLREVLTTSNILAPKKGERIYAQGEYRPNLYSVLRGEVILADKAGLRIRLGPGEVFGEMALVSGRPQDTFAIAGAQCIILETPQAAISKLLRAESSVRKYVDNLHTERAVRILLMPQADTKTVKALSQRMQLHRIKGGESFFSEGDSADRFYILRSGSVALSRSTWQGDAIVAYCAAGSYMDAAGFVADEPQRTVTARAQVAAEALSVENSVLRRLLAADERLRDRLQEDARKELAHQVQMQAQPEAGKVFSQFMSQGLGESTNVMVIDEMLCVGCDQCEKACAATHNGVSRLDRKAGPTFHSLHLPTSCRHCEHPHCMKDCPPGAIQRLPDGEVSINNTCIGCGNCVDNCPYGVIHLAYVPPKLTFLEKLRGVKAEAPAKTAAKCDACASVNGGPACVRACPTGAAFRIHAEDVLRLATERAQARRGR